MSRFEPERQSPVRSPDLKSPAIMTKRAWWLVVLNVLIPGSVQVLAGSRRLGRFGLGSTIVLWIAVVIAIAVYFLWPTGIYSVVTNSLALFAAQAVLVFYGVLWIILTLDTLRLTRLVRAWPSARGFIAGLAVIAMVVTAGGAGYAAYLAGVARGAIDVVFSDGQVAQPIDGRYTIMLLGGDAGKDRLGLRPDSISVVSIDATTGATTIIGIPRNLEYAPFSEGSPLYEDWPNGYDCGDECLVSYLYTYGTEHPDLYPDAEAAGSTPGVEATRDAVEGILGITVQYYALIDMNGFSKLIDALGGITVTVEDRLPIEGGEDENGQPINVQGWIEVGTQKMDGYTALWYARSRHGTSDYSRMERQRNVQEAVLEQFEPGTVLSRFQSVAEAGSQIVETDIPGAMLGQFVGLAGKARELDLTRLELVPPLIDVTNPEYDYIRELVAEDTAPAESE